MGSRLVRDAPGASLKPSWIPCLLIHPGSLTAESDKSQLDSKVSASLKPQRKHDLRQHPAAWTLWQCGQDSFTHTAMLLQALPKEDPMIHYIDCGAGFISAGNHSVNSTLLPEELHPNTEGYRVLAACLKPVVDALVLGKPTLTPA